jgi:predicted TIM-barrel fold metal-dependent hydrolase
MTYRLISGDSHMDIAWLPPDLFVANAPVRLREYMPQVKETPEGKTWYVGTHRVGPFATMGSDSSNDRYVPGTSRRLDRMEQQKFFSDGERGILRPGTPVLRQRDQDLDGVEAEVIYGILGISAVYGRGSGFFGNEPHGNWSEGDAVTGSHGMEAEALAMVYETYNEWIAEFCASTPSRLAGLACLSGTSPEVASKQLRRAADIGLRGAELDVSSVIEPIYHQDWDLLWATAAECNMPISFHTLGLQFRQPKRSDEEAYRRVTVGILYTLFQLSGAEFLASIIFSGACDRYPNFRFVLAECGIGWLPYVLRRMDQEYDNFSSPLGLSMKPSEFWARQGFSTFQDEALSEEVIDIVGVDNIIWGSDYPHPDCIWPDSREIIEQNLNHLGEHTLSKLLGGNAERIYRIPIN